MFFFFLLINFNCNFFEARSFGIGCHHKIQISSTLTRDPPHCLLTTHDYNKRAATSETSDSGSDNNVDVEEASGSNELMAKEITLEFAYMCLKNALNLLPNMHQIFGKTSTKPTSTSEAMRSSSLSKFEEDSSTTNADDAATTTTSGNETGAEMGAADQSSDLLSPNSSFNKVTSAASSNNNNNTGASSTGGVKKQNGVSQLRHKLFNCVWPSRPINIAQLQSLRSCVLVSLAYCSLCIRDYHSTIKYASILLDGEDPLNAKCPPSNGNR